MGASKWPRDLWWEAIWDAESLRPNERIVAYVYSRYAGKGKTAWCKYQEVMRRTGMTSKTQVSTALKRLVELGWLTVETGPAQHRSTVYRLTHPSGTDSIPLSGTDSIPLDDSSGTDLNASGTDSVPSAVSIPVPHISNEASDEASNPSSVRAKSKALADLGATAEEEKKIIEHIRQGNGSIKSMSRYLAAMAENGDLAPMLDRIRVTSDPDRLRYLAFGLRNGSREAEDTVRAMFGERALREAAADPGGWWRSYVEGGQSS